MKAVRIGIVTEDETDANAMGILVRRIARAAGANKLGIDKYPEKGCARVRKKAEAKMHQMLMDGCVAAIIVHDLDRNPRNHQLNDEKALRNELETIAVPRGLIRHVCIPVEELEAWFWADETTVKLATYDNKHARAKPSPHLIPKPKEEFERLSRGEKGKSRYNTNKNPELAEKLDLAICEKRCPSFHGLAEFVRKVMG